MKKFALASLLAMVPAVAHGAIITATYSCPVNPGVQINGLIGGTTAYGEWGTVINGNRQDLPAGPGVDNTIPQLYPTFCVELGENISVAIGPPGTPGGPAYTHTVLPLLGSTTAAGGLSGPVFFDPIRTSNMERLWGTFYDNATAQASLQFQQAFQVAVWEIAFDTDLNLSTGSNLIVSATDPAVVPLAQSWLNVIAVGGGVVEPLYLLTGADVQDLITPAVVPEPVSIAPLALGGLMLGRRRR